MNQVELSLDLTTFVPEVYFEQDPLMRLEDFIDSISDSATDLLVVTESILNQKDYSRVRFDLIPELLADFGVDFDINVDVNNRRELLKNLVDYLKIKATLPMLRRVISEILELGNLIVECGLRELILGTSRLGKDSFIASRRRKNMVRTNTLGRNFKLGVSAVLCHPNVNKQGDSRLYTYIIRTPRDNDALNETLDGFVELSQPASTRPVLESIS